MNESHSEKIVDKVARALLYEGYVLYPYRPSVKNQQRWTFGGVYPPSWSEAQDGTDPCVMQTQCLIETGETAQLHVKIRFLHLVDRTIGKLPQPMNEFSDVDPQFDLVPSVSVGDKQYQAWQEAVERDVDLGVIDVHQLLAEPHQQAFSFSHHRAIEPLRAPGAPVVAILIREQQALEGTVEISAVALEENFIRLSVRILNQTPLIDAEKSSREQAMLRTLVSTHTILTIQNGKFISLTDPPPDCRQHAAQCVNIGAWPVLVGEAGATETMLSSPIIVEDYPKIAPESPGDLFDSSEIDEILTLRIMTLTDEEKRLAAGIDDRVGELLARTQSLARDELMALHGTLREVEPIHRDAPPRKSIFAHGVELKPGASVRLHPLGRADAMDILHWKAKPRPSFPSKRILKTASMCRSPSTTIPARISGLPANPAIASSSALKKSNR